MNRIFHQFKKDLRHQRWALLAWGVLLLVHLSVSGFQILRHVPNPQASTEQFAALVAAWVVFLPILFIILAVQSDTPVGTSAFWLTRPLRGGQMLVAKALYVFLCFVALPLAVELAILLLRGAGTNVWLLFPEFSVIRLPVVLGAFALGATSQRFSQALMLAATGAILGIATMLAGYYFLSNDAGGRTPEPFSGSRGIVALWTLAATFATVVAVQFITRRERRGRCLFVIGIAAAMILQLVWPWNVLGRPDQLEPDASDPISLRIDPARVTMSPVKRSLASRQTPSRFITFPVDIIGGRQSAGEFLAPSSSRVELATPSSSALTESSIYYPKLSDARFRAAVESLLAPDQIRLVGPTGDPGSEGGAYVVSHSFRMNEDEFARYQRGLEELRVGFDVGLFGLEHAGELPLREGAEWNQGGDQLEIVGERWTRNILKVKIRASVLSLIFAKRDSRGRQSGDSIVFVLVNRITNTAIVLEPSQSYWRSRTTGWLSPFVRSEKMFEVNLQSQLGQDYTPEAADDWRKNSELILLRRRQLGRLSVGEVVQINAELDKS